LPDPRPVALPRIDVDDVTVEEGDEGTKSYQVEVSVTGNSAGTLRLFAGDENGDHTTRLVTVQPGHHTVDVSYEVTGNTRWSTGWGRSVLAKAIQGTVSGGYVGGLTVLNDDPEPTVTITPVADTVAEGAALRWSVTSSAVADSPLYRYGWAVPPEPGPELSSTDVDPDWFWQNAFEDPQPSRPLSGTQLFLAAAIEPGEVATEITVPTVPDNETEGTEYARFYLMSDPPDADEEILGAVTDQP
jgi:hypothetical protein